MNSFGKASRKYAVVMTTGLKSQLQYSGNLFGRVLFFAVLIFMFTRLWIYMYGTTGAQDFGGYTLNQMLWYLVMTELTWLSARPASIRTGIASDIRSGRIAYAINKPYDYIGYLISKYAGETAFSYALGVTSALIIGLIFIGPLRGFDAAALPFIAVTMFLSSMVSCHIYLLFAFVSFWVEENQPFIWIYEKFVLILGIIFPVEIYPEWAQPIIRLSPIYPTVYAPAKMTVDFSYALWLELARTQLIWLVALTLLARFVLKRGERKLRVNGG